MEERCDELRTTKTQVGQLLWATIITALWVTSVILAWSLVDGEYVLFVVLGGALVGTIWFDVVTGFGRLARPTPGRSLQAEVLRELAHPGKTEAFLAIVQAYVIALILLLG